MGYKVCGVFDVEKIKEMVGKGKKVKSVKHKKVKSSANPL